MNRYWPSRNAPEGFSIEKLARSYRDKISHHSLEGNDNRLIDEKIDKQKPLKQKLSVESINSQGSNHWANRDFEEYFSDVA